MIVIDNYVGIHRYAGSKKIFVDRKFPEPRVFMQEPVHQNFPSHKGIGFEPIDVFPFKEKNRMLLNISGHYVGFEQIPAAITDKFIAVKKEDIIIFCKREEVVVIFSVIVRPVCMMNFRSKFPGDIEGTIRGT